MSRAIALYLVAGVSACVARPAPTPSPHAPPAVVDAEQPDMVCGACPQLAEIELLPFGFYSVPPERFAELAAAGVTMVGPYYGPAPGRSLLDAAAEHGLQVIYPIGFKDGVRSQEDGRAEVRAQIDAVVDHPALGAWYVLPEELRPWSETELDYVAWVRETAHASDPAKRPILGYQPNHRRQPDLAAASVSFDVVTRGLYANYVGATHQRAWVREGAETIARASGRAQTSWAVLEMFAQPTDEELRRIHSWVRHDVYASMVGGARGVLVFSGWPRQGFPAYAAYLAAYLDVARELNGARALATPLLRGVVDDSVQLEILEGPTSVAVSQTGLNEEVPSVAWRAVDHAGTRWVYVVNSAEEDVVIGVRLPCSEGIIGPAPHRGQLHLPPLGVAVFHASA